MSKCFKFVESCGAEAAQSTSAQPATETDWELCCVCQETTTESLTRPSQSKRKDKGSGYSYPAEHLKKFNELNLLPKSFLLDRLDEGSGIKAVLAANKAVYHQTCKLKYNKTKNPKQNQKDPKLKQANCFFCGEAPGTEGLHEAATFQLDSRVRSCALMLDDMDLRTKPNAGDMVAQEAKYHHNCLLNLYNRARKMTDKVWTIKKQWQDLLSQSW